MSKYGEENGKCSDAQECALWKIFPSAGGPIFPTFCLPSPRDLLKYPMTPDPSFPHEEAIVHGRIYFSIFCPDNVVQPWQQRDLDLRIEKCYQVPSSAVPVTVIVQCSDLIPNFLSGIVLFVLSKIWQGSFIFYI